jgi:hypothetical protein
MHGDRLRPIAEADIGAGGGRERAIGSVDCMYTTSPK